MRLANDGVGIFIAGKINIKGDRNELHMVNRNCSNCNIPLENVGDMKFRVGGYSGVGGMFLGGWNQLAESTQTLTLYRCSQCGKVELYEPISEKQTGEKKHHFL